MCYDCCCGFGSIGSSYKETFWSNSPKSHAAVAAIGIVLLVVGILASVHPSLFTSCPLISSYPFRLTCIIGGSALITFLSPLLYLDIKNYREAQKAKQYQFIL